LDRELGGVAGDQFFRRRFVGRVQDYYLLVADLEGIKEKIYKGGEVRKFGEIWRDLEEFGGNFGN
jgi:hypothetical protein